MQQPQTAPGVVPANACLASWPEPDMLRQVVSRLNQWVDTLEKPEPVDARSDAGARCRRTLPSCRWPPNGTGRGALHLLRRLRADGSRLAPRRGPLGQRQHERRSAGRPEPVRLDRSQHPTRRRPAAIACRRCPGKRSFWDTARLWNGRGPISCCCGNATSTRPCWPCPDQRRRRAKKTAGKLRQAAGRQCEPWCVAVLLGDKEKKLYLFEPRLGLPIPAPNGLCSGQVGPTGSIPGHA